jgi:hypothetical protein
LNKNILQKIFINIQHYLINKEKINKFISLYIFLFLESINKLIKNYNFKKFINHQQYNLTKLYKHIKS